MSEMQTALVYFGLIIITVWLCRFSERSKKPYGLLGSVIFLSLIAGLRDYSVGIDTARYLEGIEYFYNYGQPYWKVAFSYGYGYFASVVLHIWNNYSFFLFVQALITNGLILFRLWDFRNIASISFMVFVYICSLYLNTFNIMCQCLAISIVFYSTRFLDNKQYVLFFIGLCIASAIHSSAIIAFTMALPYFVKLKGLTVGKQLLRVLVSIAMIIGSIIAYRYLLDRYSSYLESSVNLSFGIMVFAQMIVFICAMLFAGYWKKQEGNCGLRSKIKSASPYAPTFYFVCIFLIIAGYVIEAAGRLAYYFSLFGAICFGAIASESKRRPKDFYISSALGVWFLIYFAYTYLIVDGGGVIPYGFIL